MMSSLSEARRYQDACPNILEVSTDAVQKTPRIRRKFWSPANSQNPTLDATQSRWDVSSCAGVSINLRSSTESGSQLEGCAGIPM